MLTDAGKQGAHFTEKKLHRSKCTKIQKEAGIALVAELAVR
jgi:hypothetical protein